MRKSNIFHFILLLMILVITSCIINKEFNSNDGIAVTNTEKHLAHSGKFGRCSLCNNLAKEKKVFDSSIVFSAQQTEEQEPIFASNAAQENMLLKPHKFVLNEVANENIIENKIGVYSSSKKLIKHNINKLTETNGKKGAIKTIILSLIILSLALLLYGTFGEILMELLALFAAFVVIYGIVKFLKLLYQAIKETPKGKKYIWLLVPILIIPAFFILIILFFLYTPISPLAFVYGIIKLYKSANKERSAIQKLGIYLFFALTLIYMALIPLWIHI